jgi:hypothetical protein
MANNKYTCPPQTPSGAGTFSDNLVGLQLVQGGGLTQGNFEFTQSVSEKTNRNFTTGVFSEPINLEKLNIDSVSQSKAIAENNFKVYPNFDLSEVTNFTVYGSLSKRISASITTIISQFPAGLESNFFSANYSTGNTAENISFNQTTNETEFTLDISKIRNPFGVDFTVNSTRNLSLRETDVSTLRNMTVEYSKYSLYFNGNGYKVKGIMPTQSLSNGSLKIYVEGNPFSGQSFVTNDILIRPNDYEVNKVFSENLDEVENFLLDRTSFPIYTAVFNVPKENNEGSYFTDKVTINWPLNGLWNLDIVSNSFQNYLVKLNETCDFFDLFRTNLISRFLTTGAFNEFDTVGRKMEKVLQIYGRSFDETQKFVNALAYINSVNYNVKNDIPSQLLKNLAQTLGWSTNISPITSDDFLSSVFGTTNSEKSQFSGEPIPKTPDELNYQFYRNLVLNSAYLFKSKGTRKSVEILLKLIGAPEALIDFNEYVYVADQKINLQQFESQFARISGGTYVEEIPVLNPSEVFTIYGVQYTGFTTEEVVLSADAERSDYPIDEFGYPSTPPETDTYFFQSGSGWFEQTPQHRAPEQVNLTGNVFTGSNPNYQTSLAPYSYGQDYLDRFRNFPYMKLGYFLTQQIDNNKSWTDSENGYRRNLDGNYNALYYTADERLVLNVKNVDLFLNPGQGILYDIWYMSREFNYPIPNSGLDFIPSTVVPSLLSTLRTSTPLTLNNPYPYKPIDDTIINPQPKQKTFFEFAQTFWKNMINVRDRQYATNGKTMGYPTLESIYWKYLQSEQNVGIENNNFNYDTMTEYVNGIGDYWIRLVEQMMPASTIWNTGVRYENSIFHRQKFAWRRQRGCNLVPVPCEPCSFKTNVFAKDCPVESTECGLYPGVSFNNVLSTTLNNYLTSNGYTLNNCETNSLKSFWYVDLRVDDVVLVSESFFTGYGYNIVNLSTPTSSQWKDALISGLDSLNDYGYGYLLTEDDTVIIYNEVCSVSDLEINFKINIGVEFDIVCAAPNPTT